jgi:hypothetical protein
MFSLEPNFSLSPPSFLHLPFPQILLLSHLTTAPNSQAPVLSVSLSLSVASHAPSSELLPHCSTELHCVKASNKDVYILKTQMTIMISSPALKKPANDKTRSKKLS